MDSIKSSFEVENKVIIYSVTVYDTFLTFKYRI